MRCGDLVDNGFLRHRKDDEGNVKEIEFDEDAYRDYQFLSKKVINTNNLMVLALKNKNKVEYLKQKQRLYDALTKKDVWLRKYMYELGLYLKEIQRDPGKALYGGLNG